METVICPLCMNEGIRTEMEGRQFVQDKIPPWTHDRFPGRLVEVRDVGAEEIRQERIRHKINWKCPVCDYQESE